MEEEVGKSVEDTARLINLLEERFDSQEKLISNLMMGYVELTTTVEAFLDFIFFEEGETEAAKMRAEQFHKRLKIARSESMKWLNEFHTAMARSSSSYADAMANVVRENDANNI